MMLSERIIEFLKTDSPKTTHDIAREFDVSWNTAQNALTSMESDGSVVRVKVGRANLWRDAKTRTGFWFDVCMELIRGFLDFERTENQISAEDEERLCATIGRRVGREVASNFKRYEDEQKTIKETIKQIANEMSTDEGVVEVDVADEEHPTTFRIHRCPIFKYAADRPAICHVCNGLKTGALESILKRPVKHKITKSMPKGDPYCETEVGV